MDFPYSASKAQNTECTEIKRAHVRVENGEWRACLYIPRKVFFLCVADCDATFSESPTVAAVILF